MLDRILRFFARAAVERPWTVLIIAGVIALAASLLATFRLEMNANTDDLIAQEREYMQDYRRFLDEFGDLEYISVVVTGADESKVRDCVVSLTESLRSADVGPGVYSSISPEEQLRIAMRAMSDDDLRDLSLAAGGFPALLAPGGPGGVVEAAHAMLERLIGAGAIMSAKRQEAVGGGALFLLHVLAAAVPDSKSGTKVRDLVAPPTDTEWFRSGSGRLWFINILPAKDYGTLAVIEEPLRRIKSVIERTRPHHPGVEIGLTGKPVLQADEMATSDRDMTLASLLGVLLVSLPYMWVIRGLVRPALTVLAFSIGTAWTFGFATLVIGQLNLLSVVFTAILVGIGLDFGIHIVLRYLEERRTRDFRDAMTTALLTTGRGNVTGAATSCSAFFMTLFTDFQGLRELGFIAGTGLILCLLAMLIVLPAFLRVHDRWLERRGKSAVRPVDTLKADSAHPAAGDRFYRFLVTRPLPALIVLGVLTLAGLPFLSRLRFEDNLLELQARGLDSVEWEHRIIEDSDDAVWFGAIVAKDEARIGEIVAAAKTKPSIGTVRSLFDVVRPSSAERDALTKTIIEAAAVESPAGGPLDPAKLKEVVNSARRLAALARSKAPEEAIHIDEVAADLAKLAAAVSSAETKTRDDALTAVERTLGGARSTIGAMIAGAKAPLREALPESLRDLYVSPAGRYLVMLHPKENIWEMSAMRHFVADMRAIDPDATGAPITHMESISDMKQGFEKAAWLAVAMVLVLIFLDYRSLRDTLLAVLPLGVGLLWTAEAMGLFGISFNLANFFAAPILIGICTDTGVHILHRFREESADRFDLGSTRHGVVLTALTNILGFGCMILAEHRGLRSLGLVMALGSLACLVSALTILPATLAAFERRRAA